MKAKVPLVFILAILLAACHKYKIDLPQPQLYGTWELRATRGGNIFPRTYPPGNGNLIIFADTLYKSYSAGALVTKGGFKLNTDIAGHETCTFSSGFYKGDQGTLQVDTFKLKPLFAEAATSYYVKIP